MNDLTNAYRKLIEVLDSEESKSNATDNNETCLRETEEIFKSLNSRISQLQSERREQYEERESVYSRRSSRGRSSRKSGKSSHYSSSSLGKAEMLAETARLGAELKFYDIESEKVAALKRQERDIKKLEMILKGANSYYRRNRSGSQARRRRLRTPYLRRGSSL